MTFAKIRFRAALGWVDKRLSKCKIPNVPDTHIAMPLSSHGGL